MNKPLIPGGYILLSRKIIDSEIWKKPPLYLKVWIYLLSQAQHKEFRGLKVGQLFISIPIIQEACSWYVGYRKVTPTKDQIFQVIEWMRSFSDEEKDGLTRATTKATMIATTKATQGMLITIENFNVYQNSKNYESNAESTNEKVTNTYNINKNDKNDNIYIFIGEYSENENLRQALKDFLEMRKMIKDPMTDKAVKLLLSRLDKLAENNDDLKVEILNQSTLNNWKSIYPLKQDQQQQQQPKPQVIKQFTKPTNSFHNFDNKIDKKSESELEEIARKKREKFGM